MQVFIGTDEEKRWIPACEHCKSMFGVYSVFFLQLDAETPWLCVVFTAARVCKCVLLVHTTKSEREGGKC